MRFASTLSATFVLLAQTAWAQESSNQNQSDTLINKRIFLPIQTFENQTYCKQLTPKNQSQWDWVYNVVYTAFTGGYKPLADPTAYQGQGILNASAYYRDPVGTVTKVNLLRYFDGSRALANRDGKATAVKLVYGNGTKWEDGRLKIRWTPYFETIITHIVELIGVIIGCDELSFPLYEGEASMFKVHRFMDIEGPEMHYFIHNLVDSLVDSGVNLTTNGIIFGTAIDNLFNKMCSPVQQLATYQPSAPQNMCTDNSTCATWAFPNATCSPYNVPGVGLPPKNVSSADSYWELYGGDGPNHCNGYGDDTKTGYRPSASDYPNPAHWGSGGSWFDSRRPRAVNKETES